jgi:hypothetical protein
LLLLNDPAPLLLSVLALLALLTTLAPPATLLSLYRLLTAGSVSVVVAAVVVPGSVSSGVDLNAAARSFSLMAWSSAEVKTTVVLGCRTLWCLSQAAIKKMVSCFENCI